MLIKLKWFINKNILVNLNKMAQYWASHLANTSEIQPHEDIRKLRLGESITSIWHEFDKKPNGNHFRFQTV